MPRLRAILKVFRPKVALRKAGVREHINYARINGKLRRIYTNAIGEKVVVTRSRPEETLLGPVYNIHIDPIDASKTSVGAYGSLLVKPNEIHIQRIDTYRLPYGPNTKKGREFTRVMLDEAKQLALKEFDKTGGVITIAPLNKKLAKYYKSFGFQKNYPRDPVRMFIKVAPKK